MKKVLFRGGVSPSTPSLWWPGQSRVVARETGWFQVPRSAPVRRGCGEAPDWLTVTFPMGVYPRGCGAWMNAQGASRSQAGPLARRGKAASCKPIIASTRQVHDESPVVHLRSSF